MSADDSLPDDVETLKRLLLVRDAELARVRAEASSAEALISHLRLTIEKMRRELYGQRSERKARLLNQMELELEELEAATAEDELAAEKAMAAAGDRTACEAVSQTPAPFHVLPRGFAGPSLLAMILFEKYGQHQPLNRQAERYAREGVSLSLSTLADQVGGCAMVLRPLYDVIRAHVFAAGRVHGDDTPVPVLARGKTATVRRS